MERLNHLTDDQEWVRLHRWFRTVVDKHQCSTRQCLHMLEIEPLPVYIQYLSPHGEKIPLSTKTILGQTLRIQLLAAENKWGVDPTQVSLDHIDRILVDWKEHVEDLFLSPPHLLKEMNIELINVTDSTLTLSIPFTLQFSSLQSDIPQLMRQHVTFIPSHIEIIIVPIALIAFTIDRR